MAFDLSRLRTDQLQRLASVGGDLSQLETDEIEGLLSSQEDFGDIGAGLQRAGASLQLGLAGALGSEGMAESAMQSLEDVQRQYTPDVPSFTDITGPISGLEYIQEQLTASAPQMIAQLGAGALGTRFGGPRAGVAAATGVGTPFFAGMNIERQIEEQGIGFEDAQVAKAYGFGVGQAALDALIGRTLGVFGPRKGAEEIAKAAQQGMARRIGGKFVAGAAVEAPTEAFQQILEIVQANPEKLAEFGPEVRAELMEAAVAGGLVGGVITAPTGIPSPQDPAKQRKEVADDLTAHLQDEMAETSNMEGIAARFGGQKLLTKQDFELEAQERLGIPFIPEERAEAATDDVIAMPGDKAVPETPRITDLEEDRTPQSDKSGSPVTQAQKALEERGRFEAAINRFYDNLQVEEESAPVSPLMSGYEIPPAQRRLPPGETIYAEGTVQGRYGEAVRDPEAIRTMDTTPEQIPTVEGEFVPAQPAQASETLALPTPTIEGTRALPRGTGAIQVPPRPSQRANLIDRIAGLTELTTGVAPPPVTTDESLLRLRRGLELVDPFSDVEAQRLLDNYTKQTQAGRTRAATNARRKLEKLLVDQGYTPEGVSRALNNIDDAGQLRLFSKRNAAENAQKARDKAIAEAYTMPTIELFNERVGAIQSQLRKELDRLGLKDVDLNMQALIRPTPDSLAEGVTDQVASGRISISLASQIYDPSMTDADLKARLQEVMNHEMIHAMKMAGVFSDSEYQTLVNAAKKQKFVDRNGNERKFTYFQRARALYMNDSVVVQEEEAVAELFRDWAAGRKKIGGKPQSLLNRIVNFIKGLGKSLSDNGFNSSEDIFRRIQSGEIGARDRKGSVAQKEERAQARQQMFSKRSIRPFPPIQQMNLPENKRIVGGTYLDFTDPTKPLEDQEVFNNRAFAEGGVYINQQTGRPALIVDDEREVEANVTNKGPTGLQATYPQKGSSIRTNLFRQEAGWKWQTPGFENIKTVISVESGPLKKKLKSGSDHAYALATNFLKPYTLTTFPDSINKKTGAINQPSLRPSTIGDVRLGKVVGQISVRGKLHDVYESVDIVDPDDSPMQFITASEAGIDDTKGTQRLSKKLSLNEWLGNSAIQNDVYHATFTSFPALDPDKTDDGAVHFGPNRTQGIERLDEVARFQIVQELEDGTPMFPRVITAKIKMENPLVVPFDLGNWGDINLWRSALERGSFVFTQYGADPETLRRVVTEDPAYQEILAKLNEMEAGNKKNLERQGRDTDRMMAYDLVEPSDIWLVMDGLGYDGLIYKNFGETSTGEDSYLVWSAQNIYVKEVDDIPYSDIYYADYYGDPREGMTEAQIEARATRPILGVQSKFLDVEDVRRMSQDPSAFAERSKQFSGQAGTDPIEDPARMFSRRVSPVKAESNPFEIDLGETIVPIYPGTSNVSERKPGSTTVAQAVREMYERYVSVTGNTEPLEYNEENKEIIARKMATEALKALEYDNNAIGWYDDKINEAKRILSFIEPRAFDTAEHEAAFDYALAVTSNGQAVIDNFPLALDAFDYYLRTGRFPEKEWKSGGERSGAMRAAWSFFNTYNELYEKGAVALSLPQFLDSEFEFKTLRGAVKEFNKTFGTRIAVPEGDIVDAKVYGSRLLGPKIGQGFYQNIRGNFEPLTADLWWMRMWNRMVNDPFKSKPSKAKMNERRSVIREELRNPTSEVERQVIKEALDLIGATPGQVKSNTKVDELATAINKRWERYFANYKKQNGVNPEKPNFFKVVKTHAESLVDAPVATPRRGSEKQFMIETVNRAKQLLSGQGLDINTADFQALLWYPEKRLFRALGVKPGRGEDNDYVDAAIYAAKQRGIPDANVEEARADTAVRRGYDRSGAEGQVGSVDPITGATRYSKRYTAGQSARLVANRAGVNGQVWNVTGGGATVRGLDVVRSFDVSNEYIPTYSEGNISTPTVYELDQSPQAAQEFETAIRAASEANPFGAAVYVYPVQTTEKETGYNDMRLFTVADGTAGFALKGNDIVSVFNTPGNGLKNVSNGFLRLAIEQGGRKLDAFDTVLPYFYANNGFKPITRLVWDEEQAPDNWDKGLFSKYNNGEPDVVFMAYNPIATEYKPDQGEYALSYEEAVAKQDEAASKYSKRFSATAPSGFDLDSIVERLIQTEPETNPIGKMWDKYVLGRVEGETRWEAFTRNAINRFIPGYMLDNYVNGEISDPANSVGRAMELSQNMTGRIWGLSELGAMQFEKDTGTISVIDAPDNMGLRQIFEPIGERYRNDYYTYAIGKREIKLAQQGRRGFYNLSMQDPARIVAEFERKYPFFKNVHDNYKLFNQRMVQMAIDSGLITKEQGDVFMDMDYVPYYRYAEPKEGVSEFSKSMAAKAHASLTDPNVFERELEGGTLKLGDMYENITRNASMIISASLKNYAMQKTADALDQAEKMGGPKSWGRKAVEGEAGQTITFYKNGEKVRYKIDDPALWSAVSGLTQKQKEGWIKGLEIVAGFLRSGVTLSPGFQLANLWRGKIDAYVKTGIEPHRFDRTIKAIRDVYAGDKDVERFKLVSGMGGFLYGADSESMAKNLKRGYRINDGGGPVMQKIGDRFMQGVQALEKTGEASEMAERIVIMRKMMENGMSEKEAIFQGLNLINFGRRGAGGSNVMSALVNFLIPTVPFLNARIQGLYKMAEDPNMPGSVRQQALVEMAGRGLLVTAGSMAMALLAMQDEDRWDNETVVEKVTNDIIYIGDYKLRIPKAFEIGAIFGTIPVMAVDAIRQQDGSDFATAAGHIVLSTFAFNPVPQGVLPVFEVIGNYDTFRGAPVEGISLQRLPEEMRAYSSTPELYKWLSRNGGAMVGLSPVQIQQLFEGYTGTIGSSLIATTDVIASATGAIPEKPDGVFGNAFADSLTNIAGLNRFIREDGTGASRFVSDFYALKRDVDQTYTAIRDAATDGNRAEIDKLLGEKGKAVGFRTYFNGVSRQLTDVNKAMDVIRRDPNMSSSQKKEELLRLRKLKVELTRKVVKTAKQSGYFD